MNPWPLSDLQTDITMHWVINTRGMGNSLNPLDHPWNFDSATVAKHRLRFVIKADRESCESWRWVKKKGTTYTPIAYSPHTPIDLLRFWWRNDKARYRWERRR